MFLHRIIRDSKLASLVQSKDRQLQWEQQSQVLALRTISRLEMSFLKETSSSLAKCITILWNFLSRLSSSYQALEWNKDNEHLAMYCKLRHTSSSLWNLLFEILPKFLNNCKHQLVSSLSSNHWYLYRVRRTFLQLQSGVNSLAARAPLNRLIVYLDLVMRYCSLESQASIKPGS